MRNTVNGIARCSSRITSAGTHLRLQTAANSSLSSSGQSLQSKSDTTPLTKLRSSSRATSRTGQSCGQNRSAGVGGPSRPVKGSSALGAAIATAAGMAEQRREFDVVVWGATGFVGKLVCERLARKYQGEVNWAMAGRNKEKLEGVRQVVAAANGAAKDTEILIGDIKDPESLRAIARRTKVIIALAGPYQTLGEPVVEACLQEGTHYVDITGEPWFIRRIIDKYHDEAATKGVRIVPCCGYDSIPSDLGTWFVVDHVKKQLGKDTSEVRMLATIKGGALGGGTVDSLLGFKDISRDERRAASHPYGLNPPDKRSGPDGRDSYGVGWVPELGKRTYPFIMAAINTRVVRRSNALMDDAYGSGWRYSEAMPAPSPDWLMSYVMVGALGLGLGALTTRGIGGFLRKRMLPAPGEGPDEKTRESASWKHYYLATPQGESQATVQAEAYGKGDAGFGSTSRMVLEAGLTLALQLDDCENAGRLKGGILTPASAMGPVLIDRLQRNAECRFSISPSIGHRGDGDTGAGTGSSAEAATAGQSKM